MTVVRIITYEGSRADVERQMAGSMKDGVNRPGCGVEITITTVFDSTKVVLSKHAFSKLDPILGLGPIAENIRPVASAEHKIAKSKTVRRRKAKERK